jgi:hypothetical protein
MAKTATRYSIKDLAAKIDCQPKKTRRLVRSLGRKLPQTERSYSFNFREFNKVVREVEALIASFETECDSRCTHSVIDACECHCGGANHGIHAG